MKMFEKSPAQDFKAETLRRELWQAVTADNMYEVGQAIEKGAKPNTEMLVYAVGAQKTDLANKLMDAGAEPHSGMMVMALNNRDEKMITALIERNVLPTADNPGPRREHQPQQ